MVRWTDMDSDAERLPDGFERTGYDADTQTYTFRDANGNLYESEPGNRYGELQRVDSCSADTEPAHSTIRPDGRVPPRSFAEILGERDNAVKKDNREAVRMMLPFALLVLVFLMLVFKLLYRPETDHGDRQVVDCAQGSHEIQIAHGDTCWEVAQRLGLGVKELLGLHGNELIDCDALRIGQGICVPM
ncbi:hypothetical protein BDW02DRAFT_497582 [Decorospora gaudefroyi]|uniref:LysM domain-containing protein n=1 Tax=Decorospora gaudefroyi TaxID=184978 RepID=A0A6A5KA92_9PLEO|nr:hypothetical protein BDW02DRAFT_497582 [Decorospora gaudefroyi]